MGILLDQGMSRVGLMLPSKLESDQRVWILRACIPIEKLMQEYLTLWCSCFGTVSSGTHVLYSYFTRILLVPYLGRNNKLDR